PARGRDLQIEVQISFRDAAFGKEIELDVPSLESCSKCDGTGSKTKAGQVRCPTCGGTGEIRKAKQTVFGQMVNVSTCPECRGMGTTIQDPCPACAGSGLARGKKKLKVSVPAGIDSGQRLRLSGEGEPGERGAPKGDLYVTVIILEHEFFKRDGQDVFCEVPISFVQAVLGDEIDIPTLYGTEKIRINPGTQTGTVYRLREKGFPHLRGYHKGDQHVLVRIVTPTKLNAVQKKKLQEFAEAGGEEIRQPQKKLFGKIKELFI
ncbi:MAG TPA: DnaJ C-terminal domain-containing protein, partial [bacterium]|nr:DnaJ C-terminal domain-containing protein [bacterium]